MALKSTIFKVNMNISDTGRHYYAGHSVTVARHPSETDERMMIRIAAFAFFAEEDLSFTKGLSAEDEPELWSKDLSGDVKLWVEFGQPDERRIKKACGTAEHVAVICYGRTGRPWWEKAEGKLKLIDNLSVLYFEIPGEGVLESMVARTMDLQFTIDSGHMYFSSGSETAEIEILEWKGDPSLKLF